MPKRCHRPPAAAWNSTFRIIATRAAPSTGDFHRDDRGVGERYWPRYFQAVRDCLKPGGLAVLQVITIAEERFDAYRRSATSSSAISFPAACC